MVWGGVGTRSAGSKLPDCRGQSLAGREEEHLQQDLWEVGRSRRASGLCERRLE